MPLDPQEDLGEHNKQKDAAGSMVQLGCGFGHRAQTSRSREFLDARVDSITSEACTLERKVVQLSMNEFGDNSSPQNSLSFLKDQP